MIPSIEGFRNMLWEGAPIRVDDLGFRVNQGHRRRSRVEYLEATSEKSWQAQVIVGLPLEIFAAR